MRAANKLAVWLRTLRGDDSGTNLVEYAILLAFIVMLSVAAITIIGEETSSKFVPVTETL